MAYCCLHLEKTTFWSDHGFFCLLIFTCWTLKTPTASNLYCTGCNLPSLLLDLRMNMIEIQARGPPSTISSFDKESLNPPQFVQLMETFAGEETTLPNVKRLVEFVKEGYVQTEKEKIRQMERVSSNIISQSIFSGYCSMKQDTDHLCGVCLKSMQWKRQWSSLYASGRLLWAWGGSLFFCKYPYANP